MAEAEVHGHVASAVPGRVRIRIHRPHRGLMSGIKKHLETQEGISTVRLENATGSVLVHYRHPTTSHEAVLEMLRVIGILVHNGTGAKESVVPRTITDAFREDRGMVTRAGPLVVDWPRSFGYFGAVALAVVFDVIPLSLGAFIAAVPFIKLLKQPSFSPRTHFVAAILEGAAVPVGGESESVVRLAIPTHPREARSQVAAEPETALQNLDEPLHQA